MKRELIVDCKSGGTRAAVLEDGELVELHLESGAPDGQTETLYYGRVQAVRPSVHAAFVEIGQELNAFDVHNLTQMFLLFFKLLDSILRFPLKWRERLRYKAAGRAIHPQAARPDIFRRFKILANYLGGQISNAIQVLRGLRRQADGAA